MQPSTSFYSLNLSDLEQLIAPLGARSFVAKQLFKWVYQLDEKNPLHWTDIKLPWREHFAQIFDFSLPQIIWKGESQDGTIKYLLKLKDGNTIEAVAIKAPNRRTLCLSSQVGCAMGCSFCLTSTQGLTRHLKVEEVIGQFLAVQSDLKSHGLTGLSNIVYMGQGEPLHNFKNTKKSVEIFIEPKGLGLGQRKITVSTSGLVPQIEKLDDFPPVNMAISLHAVRDDLRSNLMPINKRFDLKRLLEAIRQIPLKAHRYITYEYILIKNLNDQLEDIEGLVQLLNPKKSKVNIIPFNPWPGSTFEKPEASHVLWFNNQLNERGLVSTIRTTKGDDILAACGQLKSLEKELSSPVP